MEKGFCTVDYQGSVGMNSRYTFIHYNKDMVPGQCCTIYLNEYKENLEAVSKTHTVFLIYTKEGHTAFLAKRKELAGY